MRRTDSRVARGFALLDGYRTKLTGFTAAEAQALLLAGAGGAATAVEGLFVVEDVHNFGAYYDDTLMAWNTNFQHRRSEMAHKFGDRFCRMWEYYLLQNAAASAAATSASDSWCFRPAVCAAATRACADGPARKLRAGIPARQLNSSMRRRPAAFFQA